VQVGQVNALTANIAELNQRISEAKGLSQDADANDLLDKRDLLLKELSSLVSFTTIKESSGAINVFIGNGQALVLNSDAAQLTTVSNGAPSNPTEIAIERGGFQQIVTGTINGGQIGGLLSLRENGVNTALDELGLMHTQLAYNFNALHTQGVDLNGNSGGNLFTSINDSAISQSRVFPGIANFDKSSVASVTIDQPALLQNSDYTLRFSDASGLLGYQVTRSSDGEVVAQGAIPASSLPQTLVTDDGFSVNLERGQFQAGDTFTLRPTYLSAGSISLLVENPESLALALPISTVAASSNLGGGVINQVAVNDVSALSLAEQEQIAALQASSPPLVIRFNSDTSYDILDNSNPAQPVDFVPPLQGFTFISGISNPILSTDPDSQIYATATGSSAFSTSAGLIGATNNGYGGETISVTTRDPVSGTTSTQTVVTSVNESAETIAARINAAEGLSAQASTSLTLTINDNAAGQPLELRLNGVELTSTAVGAVPSPVTADFLAERINNLLSDSNIVAQSDGGTLSIRSLSGSDLQLQNFGTGADSVSITSVNGQASAVSVTSGQESTVGGTVSVISDSNVSLSSSGGLFGGSAAQAMPVFVGYDIEISGQPLAGDEFYLTSGAAGTGDNRNALALAGLQSADISSNGQSLSEIYTTLVGNIGNRAGAVAIDKATAESVLAQTENQLASIAGVNLDEEAALLIQYEQAYNASARVISVARSLFDSLLAAFN
jgi:flagellar hook-associated protein 1 FlgK